MTRIGRAHLRAVQLGIAWLARLYSDRVERHAVCKQKGGSIEVATRLTPLPLPSFFPLNPTSNFTDYTMARFGVAEQRQLRWLIDDLTERGVLVMLSNSDVDWVHAAYETARYAVGDSVGGRRGSAGAEYAHHRIDSVPARRMINSRGDRRSAIAELVVMNPPLVEALERGAAS